MRPANLLLAFAFCGVLAPVAAHAQATRTWVSGVGDDVNPCSRTAPCKTFAGAISKTADGGEINAIDPAGFGTVTIVKSMTIDGSGVHASILNSGTNGVIINAPNEVVHLRNLSIHGAGSGITGIRVISAAKVFIENVYIAGSADGIDFNPTGSTQLVLKNVTIAVNDEGLKLRPAGTSFITVTNSSITGGVTGVFGNGGFAVISDSVISNHAAYGIYLEGSAIVNVERSQVDNNTIGLLPASAGNILRISDSGFYNNNTAFACGAGALVSAGNNRRGASPNLAAPACSPTMSVQIQ